MKTHNLWIVKFIAGNPDIFTKVRTEASGPSRRSKALESANIIASHDWRVWVEHVLTKERIFESQKEIEFNKQG